MRGAELVVG